MPKHPRRRSRRKLAALALSVLCLAGFLYWSNTALQVTRFSPAFTDLPAGFDAPVSDTKDMVFRNVLPYDVRIEFESLDGVMTAFLFRDYDE